MQDKSIRVRFAPSPTGMLHIGGLRTALYNYLFARQLGGTFVLRIEDTDQKRFVEGAEEDILDSLNWADLIFDEGPGVGGAFGPYHQSHRKARYGDYAKSLVDSGKAYYAFDTADEIEAMRLRYKEKGVESVAYGVGTRLEMNNSLTLSEKRVNELLSDGSEYVIRLLVPEDSDVSFVDLVRGEVSFNSSQSDDQVLIKSDGLPTYHLANVVDDHEMEISHVIRGEEWLPSTPKHLLLYKAFAWEPPTMAHLPLILSPNGGKLSKRNADKMGIPVSVRQYVDAGYEPEALVNFLALLGWHPDGDRELFSLEDLVSEFDIDRVGSAGVQFDLDKLKWYNEQYLRGKSDAQIAIIAAPFVNDRGYAASDEFMAHVAGLLRERISFARDIADFDYLFQDPTTFDPKVIKKRWAKETPSLLAAIVEAIRKIDKADWNSETLHDAVEATMTQAELGIGKIMPQLRLAISGAASGPDLFPMMVVLGKDTVCQRLSNAPGLISASQNPE